MDWLGIGVLIIGIALLILTIILIKPLTKLSAVLESLRITTNRLPTMLDEVTGQATEVFEKGNETFRNVNDQVKEFNPLLNILQEAGEASQQLSSLALDKTMTFKKNTSEAKEFSPRPQLQGFYRFLALVFYLSQKRKDLKNALPNSK